MAKKDNQQMPSSFGGLVRYFDEGEQKFQLDPKVLVVGIVGIIILEVVAKFYIF